MSLYSQNRLENVSAIGEKFVFSNFLKPVSEAETQKELEEIDAWLEANDVSTADVQDQKALDKAAEEVGKNAGEACKESTETLDESAMAKDLEAMIEDAESVDEVSAAELKNSPEFKSAVKKMHNNNPSAAQARSSKLVKDSVKHAFKPGAATVGEASDIVEENTEESLDEQLAREAIEEWYNENGYEIDDYEQGRIDMFIESVVNERLTAGDKADLEEFAGGNKKKYRAGKKLMKIAMKGEKLEDKADNATNPKKAQKLEKKVEKLRQKGLKVANKAGIDIGETEE